MNKDLLAMLGLGPARRTPREWTRVEMGWDRGECPPDLTFSLARPLDSVCQGTNPRGYVCTRSADHTGRHAAGDGTYILAVWE